MDSQNNERPTLSSEDLFGLARQLFRGRRIIIRNTIIGGILGICIALCNYKTWTSEIVLAPEIAGEGTLSGLSSMASLAGISLGSNSEAIYPELYPEIIESTPFIVELFDIPVTTMDGEKMTFLQFLRNKSKRPLHSYPMWYLKQGIKYVKEMIAPDPRKKVGDRIDPFMLSSEDEVLITQVSQSVVTSFVNKSDQIITLGVTTQDPLVSAIMVDSVRARLQQKVTIYRTQKARNDMEYTKKIMDETYNEYKKISEKYTSFSDSHFNATLSSVRVEEQDLEHQMSQCYESYTQLKQQYNAARARVQERTPAFTVIKPARVEIKPSSTPKIVVAFLWCFMFFFLTSIHVLCWDTLKGWIRTIKEA